MMKADRMHSTNSYKRSILHRRYRNQMRSDAMVAELASSQNAFAGPLLATQKLLSAQLPQAADASVQRTILSSVRLAFRIFFSLNGPGLTPVGAVLLLPVPCVLRLPSGSMGHVFWATTPMVIIQC
jgi:hypothetical protein